MKLLKKGSKNDKKVKGLIHFWSFGHHRCFVKW